MAHGFTEEEFTGQLNLRLWRKVFRLAMSSHKRQLLTLAVLGVVLAACESAFGVVTMNIINGAVAGSRLRVLLSGLSFLAVSTMLCGTVWVFIVTAGKCSTGIGHNIRRLAFAKLQELEFGYFDRRPVGWLMTRLTSDCQRLAGLLAWGLIDLIWGPTMMVAIASVMLVLDWRLALIVLAVVPPLVAVSVFFQRIILHTSRAVRKTNSQITAGYNESIMAVRTTKTLVRERANLDEFAQLTGEMYRLSVRNAVQSAVYLPIVMTLGSVGAGLALWFGGVSAMLPAGISIGALLAFMGYAGQFFGPVHEAARVFNDLLSAQAAAERVISLLGTEPAIQDSPEVRAAVERQRHLPPQPGVAIDGGPDSISRIEFGHVDFAYKAGQPVLADFNLAAAAGQTIALVGPTGGGKSTIVSLLCRFYEPTAGAILIDGVDYRRRSLHWLQSNLGIVLQTPHLFSGTVRENIRYGRLDATGEEIERAARLVNAHDFIMAMDQGYDSEVGQGGNRLSVGQKQLVSFARAVLANPRIFVMDEATSSVDTETEKLIQQGLAAVLKGRISFVIAHRLSTIRSADRIVVIERGRIVEQGAHHELIQLRGRYYELYTNQFTREKEVEILGPARWEPDDRRLEPAK